MASTTIKVSTETRDRLKRFGGATYEETILEALDLLDADDFWRQADRAAEYRQNLSAEKQLKIKDAEAELDRAIMGLG